MINDSREVEEISFESGLPHGASYVEIVVEEMKWWKVAQKQVDEVTTRSTCMRDAFSRAQAIGKKGGTT